MKKGQLQIEIKRKMEKEKRERIGKELRKENKKMAERRVGVFSVNGRRQDKY